MCVYEADPVCNEDKNNKNAPECTDGGFAILLCGCIELKDGDILY